MKRLLKNKIVAFSLSALLLGSAFGTSAFAATSGTNDNQVGISSGSLSITAPTVVTDFGTVTLDGTTQIATAELSSWQAGDNTGTGNGWHITVQASQFTEVAPDGNWDGTGETGSPLTLPLGVLALSSPSTITTTGSTSPAPTVVTGAPWTIDSSSAVKIISANANEGMGTYDIAMPATTLTLTLDPATTQADLVNYPSNPTPYKTTLTWSIVTGP